MDGKTGSKLRIKIPILGTTTCKLCGEEFKTVRERNQHVKTGHGISLEEYYIRVCLEGKHPVCECGCGTPVSLIIFSTHFEYSRYTKIISIPYFDLETYSSGMGEYSSFEDWKEKFIGKLLQYGNMYINVNRGLAEKLQDIFEEHSRIYSNTSPFQTLRTGKYETIVRKKPLFDTYLFKNQNIL